MSSDRGAVIEEPLVARDLNNQATTDESEVNIWYYCD